ncbi:MAG: DNA-3-methyladenine glycosylase [Ardenticatenaceae bacterium]|nr:DNA-3-methyladenine glycosylase [Anaerolineales bacterium]MCB8941517.1 DNA-3-methyladenine glycosylase [Ardenticatenaceae bacterium]MCB8974589.1 DNA-3-methyladenine glycosylase [Ardenticatenaceae bacterium]
MTPHHNQLPVAFYARPARQVAQELLGKKLVRQLNGRILSGIIVETEAYCDGEERDLACHGERANNAQPTPRTAVMFGPAGYAYVYFTYGIHWLFNVVTGQPGQPNAVLIRALQPVDGVEEMMELRGERPLQQLTNGPAKLTQALAINKSHNAANLCQPGGVIWIEEAPALPQSQIATGPRIGLGKTPEPWLSMPWRYWLAGNPFVSK